MPDPDRFLLQPDVAADWIEPGSGPATDDQTGLVELATADETVAGTDTTRAVTPAGVKAALGPATETAPGLVELATETEAIAGTDATRAVTPAGVKAAVEANVVEVDMSRIEAVVTHDGSAGGGPRPTGYKRVRWVSPPGVTQLRPTNMLTGDVWERDV